MEIFEKFPHTDRHETVTFWLKCPKVFSTVARPWCIQYFGHKKLNRYFFRPLLNTPDLGLLNIALLKYRDIGMANIAIFAKMGSKCLFLFYFAQRVRNYFKKGINRSCKLGFLTKLYALKQCTKVKIINEISAIFFTHCFERQDIDAKISTIVFNTKWLSFAFLRSISQ